MNKMDFSERIESVKDLAKIVCQDADRWHDKLVKNGNATAEDISAAFATYEVISKTLDATKELYELVREEVEAQQCGSDCKTCMNRKHCWVAKAKAALAKAAGEDNNNNNKKGK